MSDDESEDSIYRLKAIESRLAPEKADTPIKIVKFPQWLLLGGVVVAVVFVIAWSFIGTIFDTVHGSCILMKNTGITKVTASVPGRVIDISVKAGDNIEAGQIIARLEQNDLRNQIYFLSNKRAELLIKNTKLKEMNNNFIADLKQLYEKINKLYMDEIKLAEKGVVSKPAIIEAQEKTMEILHSLQQTSIELISLDSSLSEADRELALTQEKYEDNNKIYAPVTGKVIDVAVREGTYVTESIPIIHIEPENNNTESLQSYIYISAEDGKKIEPGMSVNIELSLAKPLEYGTLLGKIMYVSPYPINADSFMEIVQNKAVVDQLLGQNPKFQLIAELIPDTKSQSGYRWTSKNGPPITLQSGTFCKADIKIKSRHPIQLLIPNY